jgi:hypothetical protein
MLPAQWYKGHTDIPAAIEFLPAPQPYFQYLIARFANRDDQPTAIL